MPVSGITLTPEVLTQWNGLRLNTNVNHIQIGVVDEQFTILTSGAESDPEQLQRLLAGWRLAVVGGRRRNGGAFFAEFFKKTIFLITFQFYSIQCDSIQT